MLVIDLIMDLPKLGTNANMSMNIPIATEKGAKVISATFVVCIAEIPFDIKNKPIKEHTSILSMEGVNFIIFSFHHL